MVKLSISVNSSSKKTNIRHNNRELDEEEYKLPAHKHIIRELSKENVVLVKKPIEEVYEELFGEALKEYNSKQKREDRKIKNYLKHIKKSKSYDYQREFIIAVGDKDYFDDKDMKFKKDKFQPILIELVEKFKKNNPNLYVYNAVIHFDEQGAPHAHVNVVPFATGYKKGLKVQPSFRKALFNQGYKNSNKDNLKNFYDKQVKSFEEILKKYGIERKLVGTNKIKDMREYKAVMREIDKIKERVTALQKEKQELEQTVKTYKSIMDWETKKVSEILEKRDKLEAETAQISTEIKNMEERFNKVKSLNNGYLNAQRKTIESNKQENYNLLTENSNLKAEKRNLKTKIDEIRGQFSTEIKNMDESIEKKGTSILERVNSQIQEIKAEHDKEKENIINIQEKSLNSIVKNQERANNIIKEFENNDLDIKEIPLTNKIIINCEDFQKVKNILQKLKDINTNVIEIKANTERKVKEIKEIKPLSFDDEITVHKKLAQEEYKNEVNKDIAKAKPLSFDDRIAMFEKQEQREIKNKTDKKIEKEKGTSLRL